MCITYKFQIFSFLLCPIKQNHKKVKFGVHGGNVELWSL